MTTKNSESYNYILSTNVKDENNILEWIIYHLLIGFDRILIIDNNSKIPVSSIIEKYNFKDKVDIITSDKRGKIKVYFLNEIVLPYMKKKCKKYFIHLDGDEYINLNDNYESISELLEDYKDIDILLLNWVIFGSNNKKVNDNKYKCLLPTYTKCSKSLHYYYKCFIKVNEYLDKFDNPHHIFKKTNTIYTNIKRQKFSSIKNIVKNYCSMKPKYENLKDIPVFINHYSVQSIEDYKKRKVNRPRDDINRKRHFNKLLFNRHNDMVYDNLNKKYYIKIKNIIENDFNE